MKQLFSGFTLSKKMHAILCSGEAGAFKAGMEGSKAKNGKELFEEVNHCIYSLIFCSSTNLSPAA